MEFLTILPVMDGVEGSLIFLRQELMIGGVRQILND